MQPAYNAYPYKTVQWPAGAEHSAPYYAPQAGFPSAYSNGGGGREPAISAYPAEYQPWPQMAAGNTPMPRPRKLERQGNGSGNTPMPRPKQLSNKNNAPLKSAMRRAGRTMSEPAAGQMQRTRTVSDSKRTLNPMTRTRTNSNAARDIPDHLFVTILGTSELRIQNINLYLVNELRNSMVAQWPHGVESESTNKDNTWAVNFRKSPWSATGTESLLVLRMINQLFTLLNLSHNFMTTINVGSIPRLAFAASYDPGEYVRHFVAYFSANGRRLTMIDPPHQLGEAIGSHLRAIWPNKIASDKVVDNGIYTVTLKSTNFGSYTLDKHLFMSYALQTIRSLGYKLLASVPLARRGPLGIGSRREVWIFKDMMYTRSRSKSGASKQ